MSTSYRYILLDSLNHAHRAWWSVRHSTTSDGRDNSLERGFLKRLLGLHQEFDDAEFVLAWDGKPQRQLVENPDYKANRTARHSDRPADWKIRCSRLREALAGLYPTLIDPMDEADVEIARFLARREAGRALVVSTDGDLLQLLSEDIDVLRPGLQPELVRISDFVEEYGFPPSRLPLFRALTGDASDGVAGLERFPKKAARLLTAAFGSVDELYSALHSEEQTNVVSGLTPLQRRRLVDGEDRVRSNMRLFDLLVDSGEPHLQVDPPIFARFRSLMEGLDLAGLAATLEWRLIVRADTPSNILAVAPRPSDPHHLTPHNGITTA